MKQRKGLISGGSPNKILKESIDVKGEMMIRGSND